MAEPNRPPRKALLLVDHGSRLPQANQILEEMAERLRRQARFDIVVAAHMDRASPSIAEGLAQCLASGVQEVVVLPYFLVPGRHSAQDIPRIVAEATPPQCAARIVQAEPLGVHQGLVDAVLQRAEEASPGPEARGRRGT